jgi:phosphonatase-like hydrolase
MIELVIFDMAGTTVHDQHEVETCFAKACQETSLSVSPERILELQGYSKIEVFKMLWHENYPNLSDTVFKLKVDNSYKIFCEILENHYLTNGAKPTLGCLELFQFLKENNIKIALTTGFYRKVTDIILRKLGWFVGLNKNIIGKNGVIIDASIASNEVANGRPKPDMILKAMEMLNITDHKKVMVIGDTPSDILAGDAADVGYVVAITNGTHSADQLRLYYPQIMVNSLIEFKSVLTEILSTKN